MPQLLPVMAPLISSTFVVLVTTGSEQQNAPEVGDKHKSMYKEWGCSNNCMLALKGEIGGVKFCVGGICE